MPRGKAVKKKEAPVDGAAKSLLDLVETYSQKEVGFLDLGVPPINFLFDGPKDSGDRKQMARGLPLGKFIEIYSESGLGKTTILLYFCEYIIRTTGKRILYLDYEGGVTPDILEKVGLIDFQKSAHFLLLNPQTYKNTEDFFTEFFKATVPGDFVLTIVDSLNGILTETLDEGSVESNQPGVDARVQAKFFKKFKHALCIRYKMSVIFVSQMRVKIDFRNPAMTKKDSSATESMKFWCDIRVEMKKAFGGTVFKKKIQTVHGEEEVTYGVTVQAKAIKHRGNDSGIPVQFPIIWGRGISLVVLYADILLAAQPPEGELWVQQKSAQSSIEVYPPVSGEDEVLSFRWAKDFHAWVSQNISRVEKFVLDRDLFYFYKEKK